MEAAMPPDSKQQPLLNPRPYAENSSFRWLVAGFKTLTPSIRYPIIGVSAFFGLLPAVALFYGLLVGVEFTARYSLHQAYCAISDEGSLLSSRVTLPASCRGSDSELAHQTVRNVFTSINSSNKAQNETLSIITND